MKSLFILLFTLLTFGNAQTDITGNYVFLNASTPGLKKALQKIDLANVHYKIEWLDQMIMVSSNNDKQRLYFSWNSQLQGFLEENHKQTKSLILSIGDTLQVFEDSADSTTFIQIIRTGAIAHKIISEQDSISGFYPFQSLDAGLTFTGGDKYRKTSLAIYYDAGQLYVSHNGNAGIALQFSEDLHAYKPKNQTNSKVYRIHNGCIVYYPFYYSATLPTQITYCK